MFSHCNSYFMIGVLIPLFVIELNLQCCAKIKSFQPQAQQNLCTKTLRRWYLFFGSNSKLL
jgi:hypothetical protein